MIKSLKFFDLYNSGFVTYSQFHQALERIGLFYSPDEINQVVANYDPEGKGKIDYIEFSKMIFNNEVPKAHQMKLSIDDLRQQTVETMNYFRRTLAGRAGNGIISLLKIFTILDKDGSGTLGIAEFSSIMKEFKIDLSSEQIHFIFKIFDVNKDGSLSYIEFLRGVRGEINDFRKYLIDKAFAKLDVNNQGAITLDEVVGKYQVTRHPAVVEGRKTGDQVLSEFLETYEIYHNIVTGSANPTVTKEEFQGYYENISATIPDDEYFANVLDATWDISNTAAQPTHEHTWTDKSKYGDQLDTGYDYKNMDPLQMKTPTLRSGLESTENPWQTTTPYYQVENADRRSIASQHVRRQGRDHQEIVGEESKDHLLNTKVIDTYNKYLEQNSTPIEGTTMAPSYSKTKTFELALERFKSQVARKGTKGIIGLQKQFMAYDDGRNGTIEGENFQKGLQDFEIAISQDDLFTIFGTFNVPNTTRMNDVGLLDTIRGELNEFRNAKVELAWRRISGASPEFLDWDFISQSFNANRHPGVKAGYITEENVKNDFVETFTALHGVYHSFQPNQPVSKAEFFEYFKILSTTVPNDKVFDLIMTGVWNIDLRDIDHKTGGVRGDIDFDGTKSAWKYDFHRSIYGKMDNSPFEHPIQDVSARPARPKTSVTNDMPTAGVYSWPFAKKSTLESSVTCLGADQLLTRTGTTTNDYAQNQFPQAPAPQAPVASNGNGASHIPQNISAEVPVSSQPQYQPPQYPPAAVAQQFYQQ